MIIAQNAASADEISALWVMLYASAGRQPNDVQTMCAYEAFQGYESTLLRRAVKSYMTSCTAFPDSPIPGVRRRLHELMGVTQEAAVKRLAELRHALPWNPWVVVADRRAAKAFRDVYGGDAATLQRRDTDRFEGPRSERDFLQAYTGMAQSEAVSLPDRATVFRGLGRQGGDPLVFVIGDREEAFRLASQIAVMTGARRLLLANPEKRPAEPVPAVEHREGGFMGFAEVLAANPEFEKILNAMDAGGAAGRRKAIGERRERKAAEWERQHSRAALLTEQSRKIITQKSGE